MATEKRKVWRITDAEGNKNQVLFETSADQVTVADSGSVFTATNVEGVLAELNTKIISAGQVDDVKINNTSVVTSKIANIAVDGTYNSSTNKIATQTTVSGAINALDSSQTATSGYALASVTETNGILTAKTEIKIPNTASEVGLGNVTNDAQVKRSEMGVASGVATLDTNGKVPSSQLPSYVDDVLEYASQSAFPATGETGKIYVAIDTNKTYRWSGTAYVEISASLALGETSSTAYRGDRGKTAYDHSQLTSGNPHGVTKSDVGLGNVDNTADADKNVATAVSATTATSAGKLTSSKTFALTGDVTGSVSSDLSSGMSIATEIGAGKVGATELASNAVETAKIKDANVTADKLASNSVTTAKIADGNVTTAKIADANVTNAKLDNVGTAGTYTVVTTNSKGRVTAGGKAFEFGATTSATPSADLMIDGIFFELQA